MPVSVFIDGGAGTTGLDIAERLGARDDIALIVLDEASRKDAGARRDAFHSADIAILCLPDEAAREAVALAEGSAVRIIDASSAHRVAPGWVYGFAELDSKQRAKIAGAHRVSNPGCYATAFIALVAPLIQRGLLPADGGYTCNGVSGYSGGGKTLIARFESESDIAWRGYGLRLDHKHVPEMQFYCGLKSRPLFAPAVVPAFRGMIVDVPLLRVADQRIAGPGAIQSALREHYAGSATVTVGQWVNGHEILIRQGAEPSDRLLIEMFVDPVGTQIRLVASLDNLGKGAGGACVQNLNIMAGLPETAGLRL